MLKKRIGGMVMLFLVFTPFFLAHAQQKPNFSSLVGDLLKIVNLIIPVIFGLTLVVFLWALMNVFVLHGGDEQKVENGKYMAFWGFIGLVVMVGVWGIVYILRSILI